MVQQSFTLQTAVAVRCPVP